MSNPIAHAKEVISTVRVKTNRVILFYSAGKDSIALLDLLAKEFDEVVCVFMYFVKDLAHINKYVTASKFLYKNVTFIEVPHWNLSHIMRGGIYCKPNPKTKLLSLKDIDESVRLQTGIDWVFYGMKKADSLNRRLMLNGYENSAISGTKKVYPLSNWLKKDVLRYIQANDLPDPINYGSNASNGVGFNLDCFLYLRKYYPNDLRKILDVFPMSEHILYQYDTRKEPTSAVTS